MLVANSAAQVSTRLKIGCTPSSRRLARTSASLTPSSCARRASEKPLRLSAYRRALSSSLKLPGSSRCSSAIRSAICTRNQRSIWVMWKTSSTLRPLRKASPTIQIRSGPGVDSNWAMRSEASGAFRSILGSKPTESVSSPRIAFCRDSCRLRPMAITSPTDFICVVSTGSAAANFSKLKRGILVTT